VETAFLLYLRAGLGQGIRVLLRNHRTRSNGAGAARTPQLLQELGHLVRDAGFGTWIERAEGVVGFRLFVVEDVPQALPEALAVSIPIPDPSAGRS